MFIASTILILGLVIVISSIIIDRNKKINKMIHKWIASKIFRNVTVADESAKRMFSVLKGYVMLFGLLLVIGMITAIFS